MLAAPYRLSTCALVYRIGCSHEKAQHKAAAPAQSSDKGGGARDGEDSSAAGASGMSERKAISTRTRFEIFKRDGFKCLYCGRTPPSVLLHVDHIIPVCKGGDNSRDNLATSCDKCNLGKSGVSLTAIPKSLQDRAAESIEREKQVKALAKALRAEKDRIDRDAWEVAGLFVDNYNLDGIRKDWFQSIIQFINLMPALDVVASMQQALAKRGGGSREYAFRYFCGICWNKIRNAS